MSNIDWSKAPEGAEYARKTTSGVDWYKRDGLGAWVYMAKNGEWTLAMWTSEADCERRPAWSGEGLPPVGTKCEAKTTRGWSSGTIIAHGLPPKENLAVWQEDGELIFWGVKEYFRPIRTPEQIATEQKKVAIEQTIKDLKAVNGCGFYSIAEDLYDAGYRKITDVDTE